MYILKKYIEYLLTFLLSVNTQGLRSVNDVEENRCLSVVVLHLV